MDCIFCKIIDGEIPSYKVYEDAFVYAFLDISQGTKGHTLVIPKKHVDNLYGLDERTAKAVFSVVPKLANALKEAFNPIGLNVVNNTEKPLQSVNHFHIHLLPRYENDTLNISMSNNQSLYDESKYTAVSDAIKSALNKEK